MHKSQIQVRSKNGLVTVDLRGELDRANAPRLRAALSMAERLASHTVVIDTTDLDFVDLTALRILTASDTDRSVAVVLVKGHAIESLEAMLTAHEYVGDAAA